MQWDNVIRRAELVEGLTAYKPDLAARSPWAHDLAVVILALQEELKRRDAEIERLRGIVESTASRVELLWGADGPET